MSGLETAVVTVYFFTLSLLAVFGLHRHALIWLYLRHRHRQARPARARRATCVTVQLPIYDEMYVVERLLDSVAAIRHPRELLEIQVLDDSDDATVEIAAAAVSRLRAEGFDAHHVRRGTRRGFKAGALAEGLSRAAGEFVLILDADFVAPPEILETTLGHFEDPGVGMVQVRWGHLNRGYSLLTEVQAVLLDAHFVLEHGGRHRSGRLFNFNGTAGVWRRAAIESAGGWQDDTLTEDLDLSYRAQLLGWRFVYLPDVVAAGELPVEMDALRSQQRRWAKGSIQTGRKLLPRLLRSRLGFWQKLEATFHLTANLSYPLLAVLFALLFPALAIRARHGHLGLLLLDVPLLFGATLGVASFYLVAQRELDGAQWRGRWHLLAATLAVGVGLSLNNAVAVVEGLLGHASGFVRTPKLRVVDRADDWTTRGYRAPGSWLPALELSSAAAFVALGIWAARAGLYSALPFIALFLAGFLYVGGLSLAQRRASRPRLSLGAVPPEPVALPDRVQ